MPASEIREAIDRTSAAISADQSKAKSKNAPATARLVDGLRCEVTGPRDEKVMTDMPPAMGGTASAPNPGWLLRGALASCTATVIAMRAAKLGVELQTLEVLVESESDTRGMLGMDDTISAGLAGIRTRVKIAGDAPRETLRDIVTWADAHSPVGCTVRQTVGCSLEVEFA
jgi:uncharacterized OsmC-like protein